MNFTEIKLFLAHFCHNVNDLHPFYSEIRFFENWSILKLCLITILSDIIRMINDMRSEEKFVKIFV